MNSQNLRCLAFTLFCSATVPLAAQTDEPPQPATSQQHDPYGIMKQSIPDKVVVLTFDDACRSHADFVGPLLKQYGFGGTFYISEFDKSFHDKSMYMTWEQIKSLDSLGHEIGNHTLLHWGPKSPPEFIRQTKAIEDRCLAHGIVRPTTFAYPFYSFQAREFPILTGMGYQFARGGGQRPYRPTKDNPLNTPSFDINISVLERTGYAKTAAPLQVSVDGVTVFEISSEQITESWSQYRSPMVPIESGPHKIAITIGKGGMVMIDNIAITRMD